MKQFYFELLLLIGFPRQYCHSTSKLQKRANDSKVWIWNKTIEEFVHLNGQTLGRNYITSPKKVPFYHFIRGSTVQVLAHDMLPYISSDPNSSIISGFVGETWNALQESLQFRSNIIAVADFDEGREMLKRYEGDVYLAALVYTKTITNMYFSQPYFRNWYHLYFKQPEGKPAKYLHFKAFDGQVWSHLLMFFIFLTLVLWLTCISLRKAIPNRRTEVVLSIPTYFMGVTSAFFNTGYDLGLRSCSARIQIFIALFFGALCYYALSASLVASLAVLDRSMPFATLEEVANQRRYSLCIMNQSFVYNNFTNSHAVVLPKWKDVVNTRDCPEDMMQWGVIPQRLCENSIVVLGNRIIMATALEIVRCQIAKLPQRYFQSQNCFGISTRFKERKALSIMMSRIKSTGIAQKMEYKWVTKTLPNFLLLKETKQITFQHVKGLILIYLALIGISVLILLIEICIDRLCSKYSLRMQERKKKDLKKIKEISILKYNDNIWYYK